jgi:hypothetical protein
MPFSCAAATTGLDLLTSSVDDFTFLNEILSSADTARQSTGFGSQWEAVFGTQSGNTGQVIDSVPQWEAVFGGGNDECNTDHAAVAQDSTSSFLPSQLLDQFTALHTDPSMF